jgi:hypothetical protein
MSQTTVLLYLSLGRKVKTEHFQELSDLFTLPLAIALPLRYKQGPAGKNFNMFLNYLIITYQECLGHIEPIQIYTINSEV